MANVSESQSYQQRNEDRRKRVVLGQLPVDFLRPTLPDNISAVDPRLQQCSQQELNDRALALQMQQQLHLRSSQISHNYVGQLVIIVVEATLVKNYRKFGFNMDPYTRLSVGPTVYETHACPSGGRTPRWNKRIQSYLPVGVKTLNVEIYDESAFTVDELLAYASIQIPEAVFLHESVDGWFQLSGKQGDDKEGSIHLIISLMPITNVLPLQMAVPYGQYPIGGAQMVMVPGYNTPYPVYNPALSGAALPPTVNVASPVLPKPLTDEETKEIESMFPSIDRQVIQSVIEACGQRREAIIDSLLQISEQ